MVLSSTNDVDDDNRGIYVEDPRFGRVLVRWDTFERVDFSAPGSSGPSYEQYDHPRRRRRRRVPPSAANASPARI